MSNIKKFPITFTQRQKNERGKTSVSCQVSDRWLRFSEESTKLEGGEFISLDVMTLGSDEKEKKICELVVTREELVEALSNIKWFYVKI